MAFSPVLHAKNIRMNKIASLLQTLSKFFFMPLYHPRGGDGEGDGTEVQKGGDICIPMADYFLRNKREKKMQRWHERIGHFV